MVRLGALGDVVRTLPAVSSLRAGYPGAHLAWLVEPRAAGAVEGQPWVDEVIVFRRDRVEEAWRRRSPWPAWQELRRTLRALRSRRFDLVLDFHAILRSALWARASGAPRRLGYARPFGRELSWWLATDLAALTPRRMSRFERNQALVRFLGITAPPAARPLRVDPAARAAADAALGGRVPVAIHPGTSDRTAGKRWSAEGMGRVAALLEESEGIESVVTWGPARGERDLAEEVVAASGGAARLAPSTERVGDLAALLAACRLVIGPDTGPLHVASLVGTPVLQLLGPTHPVENAPWEHTPSRTLRAGGSSPAALAFDPDSIVGAARELLAEARRPARIAG